MEGEGNKSVLALKSLPLTLPHPYLTLIPALPVTGAKAHCLPSLCLSQFIVILAILLKRASIVVAEVRLSLAKLSLSTSFNREALDLLLSLFSKKNDDEVLFSSPLPVIMLFSL